MEKGKIDFVLPWVDGSDPEWQRQKNAFEAKETGIAKGDADANGECRYRDWGLLRYWFRAVEKFAPWVGRVFFVTCDQKPKWLDETNPRLRLVSHREYIPSEWLPTFQSNTIELNVHRIPDLSERFVLFNDDCFLLRPVEPGSFFRDGLPVVPCDLGIPSWLGSSNISRIALNNSGIVKLSTNIERQVWRYWYKFFSVRALGFTRAAKNLASILINRTMIQGCFGHLPLPHLKSTFEEIWRRYPNVMERTSRHRFRADDCVNQWLGGAWNLMSGRFLPGNEKRMGWHATLNAKTLDEICDTIRNGRQPVLCLNEKGGVEELNHCFEEITKAFRDLLPEKSSFEK